MNEIYVIKNLYLGDASNGWNVDNVAFTEKSKAIEYIQSKMNEDEIKNTDNAQKRGLLSWYEFSTKRYMYEIKVVTLK